MVRMPIATRKHRSDQRATYLMTNMVAQAPANNQGPWADLKLI
jgi:DNA/RNA endonuclease G (NUC1)